MWMMSPLQHICDNVNKLLNKIGKRNREWKKPKHFFILLCSLLLSTYILINHHIHRHIFGHRSSKAYATLDEIMSMEIFMFFFTLFPHGTCSLEPVDHFDEIIERIHVKRNDICYRTKFVDLKVQLIRKLAKLKCRI